MNGKKRGGKKSYGRVGGQTQKKIKSQDRDNKMQKDVCGMLTGGVPSPEGIVDKKRCCGNRSVGNASGKRFAFRGKLKIRRTHHQLVRKDFRKIFQAFIKTVLAEHSLVIADKIILQSVVKGDNDKKSEENDSETVRVQKWDVCGVFQNIIRR